MWSNWKAWNGVKPLVQGQDKGDSRFSVGRADYAIPPEKQVTSSGPMFVYYQADKNKILMNQLGFVYNAPRVALQVQGWLNKFKAGKNPKGIPIAAAQADIVAHSMGGLIARQMVLQ